MIADRPFISQWICVIILFIKLVIWAPIYAQNLYQHSLNKIPGSILSHGGTVELSGSPYMVEGDIIIAEHSTLFIEPGVEIRFAPGIGIDVYGTLLARGLSDKKILFTSLKIPESNSLNSDVGIREVRVTDGSTVSNGRLQLFYKKKWRNVCTQPFNWTFLSQNPEYSSQRYWNQKDITVACRSFGYDNGTFNKWMPRLNDVDDLLLSSPSCTGKENQLSNCKKWIHGKIGKGICGEFDENYALGIKCWSYKVSAEIPWKSTHWKGIHFLNSTYYSAIISNRDDPYSINPDNMNSYFATNYEMAMLNGDKRGYSGVKNFQVNWSQSILEHCDIIYAGRDRLGNQTPAISATHYPPIVKGITVSFSAFTAIEYTEIQGSPSIDSSNISLNAGDGIKLNSNYFGNVSIYNSYITKNAGQGINYISDPTITKHDYDFCTRPNLGLNQVYPIEISGDQHSECTQIFETHSGHMTIHFYEISINGSLEDFVHTQRPYLEIRDGSNTFDKLITRIYFYRSLRPQAITTTGSRVWIKYVNNGNNFIIPNNRSSTSFTLLIVNKKSHDLAISNSVISYNGLQGIQLRGLTNLLEIVSSNISSNGHTAGLHIHEGSLDIHLYDVDLSENVGAGIIVIQSGGMQNISNCRFKKNERFGLWLYISSTTNCKIKTRDLIYEGEEDSQKSPYLYLPINGRQRLIMYNSTFESSRDVAVYIKTGKSKFAKGKQKWAEFNISYSYFINNHKNSIQIVTTRGCSNVSTTVLITNNSFSDNIRPAIAIEKPSGLIAIIGSNTFSNHSKGVLMLFPDLHDISEINNDLLMFNKVEIDINYNYFKENFGNFVVLVNDLYYALHKITIRYNYFIDNVIKNSFASVPARSHINAVVVVSSASIVVKRNHFSNPLSDFEIGTRATDRSKIINASYNWFDCTNQIDQLQIDEIIGKIFDNSVRYNLARIDIYPFLRTSNLNGPSSKAPSSKNFLKDNVIGGYLEDFLILRADKSPYIVKEDIFITRTGKLQIEPSTEIMFENMIGVFVEGEIHAVGGKEPFKNILFVQKSSLLQPTPYTVQKSTLKLDRQIDLSPVIYGQESDFKDNATTPTISQYNNITTRAPLHSWQDLLYQEQQLYQNNRRQKNKNLELMHHNNQKISDRRDSIKLGPDNRLHVKINGLWGTICNKGWNVKNAVLACRSMGKIFDAASWNLKSTKSKSSQQIAYPSLILMNEVKCDDSDNDLRECTHESQHEHTCTHDNDVALSCLEPRWAGIRWGFFSRKSHLKGIVIKDAGTFDPDTGQTMAALTFDLNIHHLHNVVVKQNMYGGLSSVFHHLFDPVTIEESWFQSNGADGFLTRSPGISLSSCHLEDNALVGIKYDPYLSLSSTFDIFNWDGSTPFPDKTIINMNERGQDSSTKKYLNDNEEIYLYFKLADKILLLTNRDKSLKTIDLSTLDTNVLTIQLFGSYPFYSDLNISIFDQYESYFDQFLIKDYIYKLPFVSITHHITLMFERIFKTYSKELPYNFILSIKSISRTLHISTIPSISVRNTTILRNKEGFSLTFYDSNDNTDIFSPINERDFIQLYDSHLRQSNIKILMSGTRFIDNKLVGLSLNSPLHNTKAHKKGNVTVTCEWCQFSGNLKVFETHNLYNYNSNNVWNLNILKSTIKNNYGGIFISFPYFIEDYYESGQTYAHRLTFINNTFSENRNFTIAIKGSYSIITLSKNLFSNNLASLSQSKFLPEDEYFALIQLDDSCKAVCFNNNSFETNTANAIIKIKMTSNDGPLVMFPIPTNHQHIGIIKYNYFRFNKPLSNLHTTSYVNGNFPLHYIVGVYGVQPVALNYNIFQSNAFKYTLIAGLNNQANTFDLLPPQNLTQAKLSKSPLMSSFGSMNALYNFWDTSNIKEIRERIYDFNQWNDFVLAEWYPYLTIANLDTSQISQGSFYPDHFDPDSPTLGGFVTKNSLLMSHKITSGKYFVKYDITIAPGITLTIAEGVRLEFAPNVGILVYGSLDVHGTIDNPVIFKAAKKVLRQKKHVGIATSSFYDKDPIPRSRHLNPSLAFAHDSKINYNKLNNLDGKFPLIVRLSGFQSSTTNEGFLEYFNSTLQQWYPYCDYLFSTLNAKVICHTLGFDFDDAYYFRGWRQDIDTFWVNRIKYWAHPLDCDGNEASWSHCHPRLINLPSPAHTKCDGRLNHIFIKCRIKPIEYVNNQNLFWGNLRFMDYQTMKITLQTSMGRDNIERYVDPNTLPYDQKSSFAKTTSTLSNLYIEQAGVLHGSKASAILISDNSAVNMEGVNIQNCAWHGISYFNPVGDLHLGSRDSVIGFYNNRGVGINIINLLNSKFVENKRSYNNGDKNINSPPYLYLDPLLFGAASILDICRGRSPLRISSWQQRPLLIGYVNAKGRPKRCLQFYTTSPQKKLGFRLLHSTFSSNNFHGKNFIRLHNDYPFTSQNMITELNSTNPGLLTLYKANFLKLGIYMEMNSGDFSEQWVGQITSIPSTIYYKPSSHYMQSMNIHKNELGAINYVSVGEVTPNIHVTGNTIINNGFNALNFTTPQPIVSINVQNTHNFTFTNNFLADNKGHTFKIQSNFKSDVQFLNSIVQNNVFFKNMYGSVVNIVGSSAIHINQFVRLSDCVILNNYSPLSETIKVSQALINLTKNLIQNNTGGNHILTVYGFYGIIPHIPQSIVANYFYDNAVIDLPEDRYKRVMPNSGEYQGSNYENSHNNSVISTIFSGSSFQNFKNNYIYNPRNDYELATNYISQDTWNAPVIAQNNWWGSDFQAAISGRLKDKEDDINLKASITYPFMSSNSSILQGDCPPGWYKEEDRFCYLYVGGVMKYTEAIDFCNGLGATLPYIVSSTTFLTNFVAKHQYSHYPQSLIWIQKQPSSYLKNYDKCYALVENVIKEFSCQQTLPFVCEITPISGLSIVGWFVKPFNLFFVAIFIIASLMVTFALVCWQRKSKQRKREAFVRSNSIRSSIRSTRSLHSNGSLGINTINNRQRPHLASKKIYSTKQRQVKNMNSYDLTSLTTLTTLSEAGFKENEPSLLNENNFLPIDNDLGSETGTNLAPEEINYLNFYELQDNNVSVQTGTYMSQPSNVSHRSSSINDNHFFIRNNNTQRSEIIYENILKDISQRNELYDTAGEQSGTMLIRPSHIADISKDGKILNNSLRAIQKAKKSYADIIYCPKKSTLEQGHINDKICYPDSNKRQDTNNSIPSSALLNMGINDSAYDSNESKDNFFREKTLSCNSNNSQNRSFIINSFKKEIDTPPKPRVNGNVSSLSHNPAQFNYNYPISLDRNEYMNGFPQPDDHNQKNGLAQLDTNKALRQSKLSQFSKPSHLNPKPSACENLMIDSNVISPYENLSIFNGLNVLSNQYDFLNQNKVNKAYSSQEDVKISDLKFYKIPCAKALESDV